MKDGRKARDGGSASPGAASTENDPTDYFARMDVLEYASGMAAELAKLVSNSGEMAAALHFRLAVDSLAEAKKKEISRMGLIRHSTPSKKNRH